MISSNVAVDLALWALVVCLYAYARAWDDQFGARSKQSEFWQWIWRRFP